MAAKSTAVDHNRTIDIRVVQFGTPEYDSVLALRRRVLRIPLGLDYSEEDLAKEAGDVIVAGFEGDHAMACALLANHEGKAKMRQVAVDPTRQGQGLGRQLVEAFEKEAASRGFEEVVLNARDTAIPFYLALGYAVEGEPFVEVGIPHRRMVKRL